MEKLIDYLKHIGKVKELYTNHKKSLIELQIEKETLWIFRYISIKGKVVYGLSKLISTTEGKGKIINALEAKIIKNQVSLRKQIKKIRELPENILKNYIGSNSMEHII